MPGSPRSPQPRPGHTAPPARPTGSTSGSWPGQDLLRPILGELDIGLVEGVDAEDRSGDSGRELPAEELLTELVLAAQAHLLELTVGASAGSSGAGRGPSPASRSTRRAAARPTVRSRLDSGRCRPCRAPLSVLAQREPESSPGLPSESLQASAISIARSNSGRRRSHQRAGTIPNGESAEYRPPIVGSPGKMPAHSRSRASLSRAESGSVIAHQCPPVGFRSQSSRCATASRASSRTSRRRGERPREVELPLEVADRLRMRGVEDVERLLAERP